MKKHSLIPTTKVSRVTYHFTLLYFWHASSALNPLTQTLENRPWQKENVHSWTHLPGVVFFFFKSTFSQCSCVHKKWGLTHRPQSWLATSGRSSVGSEIVRNRGATPKCHHSCKTAEHRSQITEICTPRPPNNENRGTFEWLLQWKLSCIMFRGIYHEQETPDSTAAGRHHSAASVAVWEFTLLQPHYYCAMLLCMKPGAQGMHCSHSVWEDHADSHVLNHSSSAVLVTRVFCLD